MHPDPALPASGAPTQTVDCWRVRARRGRVYLTTDGEPGGLRPEWARALAAALESAADVAEATTATAERGVA
jgi:hypothetical protein